MSDRRKLLLIVPTLHQGGQERVVIRTAGLLADDFDITIAIFDDSDIGYDTSGLNIVNLNVPARRSNLLKMINIGLRAIRLRRLKRRLSPDICYSYGPTANLINAMTSQESGTVWIGLRNYTDALDVTRMKYCISHSSLIICCARDIETYVREKYGVLRISEIATGGMDATYTCVLPNLYDTDAIVEAAREDTPDYPFPEKDESGRRIRVIASMGRDDDQKMFWHMLKTFKLINTQMPESRLMILGAGTFDSYKRMAQGLGIEDMIFFAGEQRNPYKYLKHADVNWMTSRNEGFPNALVEGMALGLATVSTNCMTGPAEILIDGGDVYTSTDTFDRFLADRDESVDEVYPMAIFGDYGILTPAMERERDMDFAHITDEECDLAHVLVTLLKNDEMLTKYREVARRRAADYSYEAYKESFMALADVAARHR